jgi:16S rRNA (guanine527-N7)-methyltransferase
MISEFENYQRNRKTNEILDLLKKEADGLGVFLNDEAVHLFSLYLGELKTWNKKINLFSRKDDQEIIIKDFLDSLTISNYPSLGTSVLDLGSGGGFPGIPIKISRRDLRVVLSEVRAKKIFFLKHIIRILGIENLEVLSSKDQKAIEFDFVVSRAFGSITKLVETGSPYLKGNGVVISMKGKKGEVELEQELPILRKMGWNPYFVDQIELPIVGHRRVLIGLRRDVSRETISQNRKNPSKVK